MADIKRVYVDGSIIINTRYFVPIDMGCGFQIAPEGATIIEPTDDVEGIKCLLIDDEHPQSLFNVYYAKGDVTARSIATSYFSASYIDCINEYKKRIAETCDVIKRVSDWETQEQALIYKMAYVNILTALDAFICYVLLRRSLQDEESFENLMFFLAPNSKREVWQRLQDNGQKGEWEQDAIRFALERSFINTDTIDRAFKRVGFERLDYDRVVTDKLFRIRHLIVHRSGRQRDDNEVVVTYSLLADLLNGCHSLVGAIFDSICITRDKELKNQTPEKRLEEVFPGGVVSVPFMLSDLLRLLREGEPEKPLEPIQLPTL